MVYPVDLKSMLNCVSVQIRHPLPFIKIMKWPLSSEVEQWREVPCVDGSKPSGATIFYLTKAL